VKGAEVATELGPLRLRVWFEAESGEIVCADSEPLSPAEAAEALRGIAKGHSQALCAVIWGHSDVVPSTVLNGVARRLVRFPERPEPTVNVPHTTVGALPW